MILNFVTFKIIFTNYMSEVFWVIKLQIEFTENLLVNRIIGTELNTNMFGSACKQLCVVLFLVVCLLRVRFSD